MQQGLFLQKLSDALEESKNKIVFPLPVGSTIFSRIIISGYKALELEKLSKSILGYLENLLRIRGTFFH